MSLLCLLYGLLSLALLCLILWVIYWAVTTLLTAFGVAVPGQLITILKVIAVLILVIVVVRAVATGDYCGFAFFGTVRP